MTDAFEFKYSLTTRRSPSNDFSTHPKARSVTANAAATSIRLHTPASVFSDSLGRSVRFRGEFHSDPVAGFDVAAYQYDAHDAGFSDKFAVLVAR